MSSDERDLERMLVLALDDLPVMPRPRMPLPRTHLTGRVIALAGGALIAGAWLLATEVAPSSSAMATAAPPALSAAPAWSEGDLVIAQFARSGIQARALAAAPSQLLFFNARSVTLLATDEPRLQSVAVYSYPDTAAAEAALVLARRDSMIEWAAPPYYVRIGSSLVNFTCKDAAFAAALAASIAAN